MKQLAAFLLVFSLCMHSLKAEERTVTLPAFMAWSSTTIEIPKIILSDTATVFFIDAFYHPGYWIKIVSDTYLQDESGKKYAIRSGDGIVLDEEHWIPESGTSSFKLVFPPLPKGLKEIDFHEGDGEGAFKIWGIRLDGQPFTSLLPQKKQTKETPVLEKSQMLPGTATLTGYIAGYKPEMESSGRMVVYNFITGNWDETPFDIKPDGTFSVEKSLLHQASTDISFSYYGMPVYLKPGEKTHVDINLPEIIRSQSKLHKNTPSLGDKYHFSGAFAALNNEVANYLFYSLPVKPRSQEDFNQMLNDIAALDGDQYKAYFIERYNNALKEPDKEHKDISNAYRELLMQSAKLELIESLLDGPHIIEYAYKMVNQIERDEPLPDEVKPSFTKEYYQFLKEYIPSDDYLLYEDYRLIYLFDNFLRLGKDENYHPASPSLAEIMGTDKGLLFDLLKAKKLTNPILEFSPLTKEQLMEVNGLQPVYREVILAENDRLLATIEANKQKTGYTVNPVDTKEVPNEALFPAIIEPHRGKVIFIDFWATWCGPCLQAFKTSEETKKEMEEEGVVFIYFAGENSPKNSWEQMIPDIKGEHYRVTDDQWEYWSKHFSIQGVPTYMVVDKSGTIIAKQTGFPGAEWMKKVLTEALAK